MFTIRNDLVISVVLEISVVISVIWDHFESLSFIQHAKLFLPEGHMIYRSSDAGRYTCVATNNVGSDEKETDVTVNVPPTIGDGDNAVPEIIREAVNNPITLQVKLKAKVNLGLCQPKAIKRINSL